MLYSLSQMKYFLYHWASLPASFPAHLSVLYLVLLLLIGLALIFRGNYSWKVIFALLGAFLGFAFAYHFGSVAATGNFPIVLASIVGAIIGAILITVFVRIFLSLGFAYLSYMVFLALAGSYVILAAAVGILAFVVAFVLYNKIVIVLAGIIGSAAVWFSLTSLGMPEVPAQIIAGVLFAAGLYLQISAGRTRNRTLHPSYELNPGWDER